MVSYTNIYAEKIFEILKPLVGEMMASGVIKVQAKKIGLTEEQLASHHLPLLAEGIEKGLIVFIGSEAAREVADKVRAVS